MTSNARLFVAGGLLIAFGLALFVSPLASDEPDGLNRVAIDKGFANDEEAHALNDSPVAGYAVEGVESERLSTGLAGVIGISITFGIGLAVFGGLKVYRDRNRATA